MAADAEPLEILLHLPLLCEDKVGGTYLREIERHGITFAGVMSKMWVLWWHWSVTLWGGRVEVHLGLYVNHTNQP